MILANKTMKKIHIYQPIYFEQKIIRNWFYTTCFNFNKPSSSNVAAKVDLKRLTTRPPHRNDFYLFSVLSYHAAATCPAAEISSLCLSHQAGRLNRKK